MVNSVNKFITTHSVKIKLFDMSTAEEVGTVIARARRPDGTNQHQAQL